MNRFCVQYSLEPIDMIILGESDDTKSRFLNDIEAPMCTTLAKDYYRKPISSHAERREAIRNLVHRNLLSDAVPVG